LGVNRFYIGTVGELRVGHDRGRVRVHQHHPVAFLAQCLTRLHSGIIKFAALPDHDWTGADEQNFLELVISRHCAAGTLGEKTTASRENRYWNIDLWPVRPAGLKPAAAQENETFPTRHFQRSATPLGEQ